MRREKNKIKESGFTSVVIIFLIALIILGVSFFVFSRIHTRSNSSQKTPASASVNRATTTTLVITEWGVSGQLSGKYSDAKYVLQPYGGDSQILISSPRFTIDFKNTHCKLDCDNDPHPFRLVRSSTPPDADLYGGQLTQDQINIQLNNKSLVHIGSWYFYPAKTGPTYSSNLGCAMDRASNEERSTCDVLDAYRSTMDAFFKSLKSSD